jgi:hypothetical protein
MIDDDFYLDMAVSGVRKGYTAFPKFICLREDDLRRQGVFLRPSRNETIVIDKNYNASDFILKLIDDQHQWCREHAPGFDICYGDSFSYRFIVLLIPDEYAIHFKLRWC